MTSASCTPNPESSHPKRNLVRLPGTFRRGANTPNLFGVLILDLTKISLQDFSRPGEPFGVCELQEDLGTLRFGKGFFSFFGNKPDNVLQHEFPMNPGPVPAEFSRKLTVSGLPAKGRGLARTRPGYGSSLGGRRSSRRGAKGLRLEVASTQSRPRVGGLLRQLAKAYP